MIISESGKDVYPVTVFYECKNRNEVQTITFCTEAVSKDEAYGKAWRIAAAHNHHYQLFHRVLNVQIGESTVVTPEAYEATHDQC